MPANNILKQSYSHFCIFKSCLSRGKKAEAQNELRRLLLLKESSIYTEIIRDYGWNKDELLNS